MYTTEKGGLDGEGEWDVTFKTTDLYVLKVHKIENFFDSDFGICIISLIFMSKY